MKRRTFDVVVVGAGPAGIAASTSAAAHGMRVAMIDAGHDSGGQIWRGGPQSATDAQAKHWFTQLTATPSIERLSQAQIVAPIGSNELLAETPEQALVIGYDQLVLATGARERFLPFPGWTLPGVLGAGGLQALAKAGLSISGRRVVVAGTGPLLIAVAAYLQQHGAKVVLIAEQAPWRKLIPFGASIGVQPTKALQALGFASKLGGIPLRPNCWVAAAHGNGQLSSVTLTDGKRSWQEPCDYLAYGYGLVPNGELAAALGCRMQGAAVWVDQWQRTSNPRMLAAGEITGVGGVDQALVEGQIAGLVAAGKPQEAETLFADRAKTRQFQAAMDVTFALRPELSQLAEAETIVCRCEDVRYSELAQYNSWRAAKLHTRCGMGPCQGRICGTATTTLFGWGQDSVRPPIAAARVATFASLAELTHHQQEEHT